jgi:hypothetical protein
MVAIWICICAWLNCAGWILSGLLGLNWKGYVLSSLLGGSLLLFTSKRSNIYWSFNFLKWRRRFQRLIPLAFLVLSAMAILGGVLHAPSNFDGLAYREPRVLHWLAAGQWHWIHTDFQRLNVRTAGFEWITAPIFALARTDRFAFLINSISFALLPGLVFSVFTQLGVRRRVAWHWMWILPTGYCFLLQAGSIANDMFGAVFPMAALHFALRARKSGKMSDVCLSVLAAALMTSAKASTLPLLLPWIVALLGAWRVWARKPLALLAISLPAFGASFFPTAILNWNHTDPHDWSGRRVEAVNIGGGPTWLYLANNGIVLFLENFAPPVFPVAAKWNQWVPSHIPASWVPLLNKYFEPAAARWDVAELRTEEAAGLGFGPSVLLVLSVVAAIHCQARGQKVDSAKTSDWTARLVCVACWISLFFSLASLGLSGVARYCTPYYLPAIAGLLLGIGHEKIVRSRWWHTWVWISFALAAMLLVISQARPLWPARWVCAHLGERFRTSTIGTRIVTVYEVYGERADAFWPIRKSLPADASPLGLITFDDPETSLWRPFGSRRILHVKATDTGADVRSRGIKYVLVNEQKTGEAFEQWLQRMNGRLLETKELKLRAGKPPFAWHLVELNPSEALQK